MASEDATHILTDATGGDPSVEAALLLKPTGVVLAAWSREGANQQILTVMAATMMASIQTLVEALGSPTPQTVSVHTEDRQFLARRIATDAILVLIAPKPIHIAKLQAIARKIQGKLGGLPMSAYLKRISHSAPTR